VHLELNERYGDHKGRIEYRVTVDGRVVFTHDIINRALGQNRNGCYTLDIPVVVVSDAMTIAASVVSMQILGLWGWGPVSRSWLRNVYIVPFER